MAFGDEENRTGGLWSTSRGTRAATAASFHHCSLAELCISCDVHKVIVYHLYVLTHTKDLCKAIHPVSAL
ncbi:hypothetical protein KCU61_g181, partial [Aureobasidium melanogenum]